MRRMEYTYKKANRTLEVQRGDLVQERKVIESNLSRNVRKIDSTLKRMEGMRDEKKKFASEARAVAKRLSYEKDCVEQRLQFEKQVFLLDSNPSILYLILFCFPIYIKALQRKAEKFNAEKKESNAKRRKVDKRLLTLEGRHKRLQQQLLDGQEVVAEQDEVDSPQKRLPLVRYANRNRGMTPDFEALWRAYAKRSLCPCCCALQPKCCTAHRERNAALKDVTLGHPPVQCPRDLPCDRCLIQSP